MPPLVDEALIGTEVIHHANGDVTVRAPLDLRIEMWRLLGDLNRQRYAEVTGVPWIGGEAAGTWTFTNAGRTSLLNGDFDIDSDTWKVALFQSTSNIGSGSTTYAGLTNEVAAANGYSTGGVAVTLTLSGTTTVTVAVSSNPSWTASGGNIVARFAVLYEVSGKVLCYVLLDSAPADVTIQDGNSLAIDMDGTPAVFTLA